MSVLFDLLWSSWPPLGFNHSHRHSIQLVYQPFSSTKELKDKARGNFLCLWTPCPFHPKVHQALSIQDPSLVSVNHLFGLVNQQQDWQKIQIAPKIEIMWMNPSIEPRRPSKPICYSLVFLQPCLIQPLSSPSSSPTVWSRPYLPYTILFHTQFARLVFEPDLRKVHHHCARWNTRICNNRRATDVLWTSTQFLTAKDCHSIALPLSMRKTIIK